MFYNNSNLTHLNLGDWDVSGPITSSHLLYGRGINSGGGEVNAALTCINNDDEDINNGNEIMFGATIYSCDGNGNP